MYITCNNCQARYLVQASDIGMEGRTVKCTKCDSSWYQEPADEAEQIILSRLKKHTPNVKPTAKHVPHTGASEQKKPSQHNLPIVVEQPQLFFVPNGIKYATYLFSIFALLLLAAVNANIITRYIPPLQYAYDKIGMHSSDGLKFDKIEVVTIPQVTGENEMIIKGMIISEANEERIINMHLSLYDEDKNKLAEHLIQLDNATLQPNETSYFRIPVMVSELPIETTYLALDLGNLLEQKMR